jgi:hypothetical protein
MKKATSRWPLASLDAPCRAPGRPKLGMVPSGGSVVAQPQAWGPSYSILKLNSC